MARLLPPRVLLVSCALFALAAPGAHAAVPGLGGWDASAQRTVARAGVLPNLAPGRFGGQDPLTGPELQDALDALATQAGGTPVTVPPSAPTVEDFDAALVDQLGLADVATAVQTATAHAGLNPPPAFGTEVVARALGLRYDHPAADDRDELYPSDVITRAEAAWSLAQILDFKGWEVDGVRSTFAGFQLPDYTPAQRAALRIAVSKIGMPYVWGGEMDTAGNSPLYGFQAHGGYDCSGFVWRVYKLSGLPQGRQIEGRTAAQMAGEIPKSQRLRLSQLEPGDLMFFGPGKFWQQATESRIIHTAIVLSPGFLIQSSGQGVAVAPIAGWYTQQFVWGRHL